MSTKKREGGIIKKKRNEKKGLNTFLPPNYVGILNVKTSNLGPAPNKKQIKPLSKKKSKPSMFPS